MGVHVLPCGYLQITYAERLQKKVNCSCRVPHTNHDQLMDEDRGNTEMSRHFAVEIANGNVTHQASTENTLNKEWNALKECVQWQQTTQKPSKSWISDSTVRLIERWQETD